MKADRLNSILKYIICFAASGIAALSLILIARADMYEEFGAEYTKKILYVLNSQSSLGLAAVTSFATIFLFSSSKLTKRPEISTALTALVLSLMFVTGVSCSFSDKGPVNIFGRLMPLIILGIWWVLDLLLDMLYRSSYKTAIKPRKIKNILWIELGIILICWTPILIINYPGSVPYDTAFQIMQGAGERQVDASNPVLLTYLFAALFKVGRIVGGSYAGVFACVVFQATLGIYSILSVCRYVRVKTGNDIFGILVTLFFGIVPTWACAAQSVMKDSVHYPVFIIYQLSLLNYLDKHNPSKREAAGLGVLTVLTALSRKAAAIIVIISGICILFHSGDEKEKKQRKKLLIITTAVILIVQYAVYPLIGAEKPSSMENLSTPFQQMAYYYKTYGDTLTEDEKQIINDVIDGEKAAKNFTTEYSDPVKWTYHGNEETVIRFLLLYLKLGITHPGVFLKTLIACYYKYYYPISAGRENYICFIPKGYDELGLGFAFPNSIEKFRSYVETWEQSAGLNLLMGPGLYSWILVIYIGDSVRRKNRDALLKLMPLVILMFGFLLTHVNAETRYAFPLMAAAPLIITCSFRYLQGNLGLSPDTGTLSEGGEETVGNVQ